MKHDLHKHKRLRDLQYILNKSYKYIEIKFIFASPAEPIRNFANQLEDIKYVI